MSKFYRLIEPRELRNTTVAAGSRLGPASIGAALYEFISAVF